MELQLLAPAQLPGIRGRREVERLGSVVDRPPDCRRGESRRGAQPPVAWLDSREREEGAPIRLKQEAARDRLAIYREQGHGCVAVNRPIRARLADERMGRRIAEVVVVAEVARHPRASPVQVDEPVDRQRQIPVLDERRLDGVAFGLQPIPAPAEGFPHVALQPEPVPARR